jgi:cytoskeleton protein RodZ
MSSVGETLRRERLRTGLDLEKISQETKISVRMLGLIEADQFEKLPGGVFARSFVRQYARAVDLDEEELIGELETMLAPPADPLPAMQEANRHPDIRMSRVTLWGGNSRFSTDSSLPSLALVVLVIIACSVAYTWFSRRSSSVGIGEMAQSRPAQSPAEAEVVQTPRPAETTLPANTAERAGAAPVPQAITGTLTTDESGALHIALTAEEATWVRATANGKVVFSGIIQAHETKALSAPDTVTLRIGNAGGIAISLNGKAIPAVGPKGQVRVVQLSPDGAVQVEPPAPKPPPDQTVERKMQTL